ncbi:hypothetical protein RhiirB3_443259 [Rhizophagus irregularis]|nr:hypothetical protein RhiirB3_443259 [Rhizophagus irregularis]
MSEIEIEIDNVSIDSKINKPHDGKPITKIEISPNEKYLVTYSEDDRSIFGWNIEDESLFSNDDDVLIFNWDNWDNSDNSNNLNTIGNESSEPELFVKFNSDKSLHQIVVSDDKQLAYINNYEYLEIYTKSDNQNAKKIELDCDDNYKYCYCIFSFEGEFILHEVRDNVIYIYSTQTKNNKWNCRRICKIPEDFNIINISKYSKLYLFSKNSIYEHNLNTERSVRIFKSTEKIIYTSYDKKIRISSNEKLICIRINNNVVIYSIESEIPFASLDINNDIQLHSFMHRTRLIPLLIPLLCGSIIKDLYWNKCSDHLKEKEKEKCELSKKYRTIETATKYTFKIRDGQIRRIKHEEILQEMNLKSKIPDKIIPDKTIESWYFGNDLKNKKETYRADDLLNLSFINTYVDTIYALFKGMHPRNKVEQELTQELIVWEIKFDNGIIELEVHRKDKVCYSKHNIKRVDNISANQDILGIKSFNDSDIIILTTKGLFIYHFNENDNSISLSYYYYMKIDKNTDIEVFSKPTLPLSDYNSLKQYDKWVPYIKDNKERLLKYGVELLTFAIEEHKLDLIEDIYKKCMNYFKEDLGNNRMFLSIITSTMPLLNKYYPDYISRYSSETTMITDSSFYDMEYKNIKFHLYSSSQHPQIFNLTRSIWWCKYNIKEEIFKHTTSSTIIFMNPYVKFVNYPHEYNWFKELIKPESSPFVKTISKDIYKTLDGETLIDFKWNNYGKYYYTLIWIGYMALLGCFTAAATIPPQSINDNDRDKLLIASIILGFIHLSFEVRQFIYDPIKWFNDFWNYIDIIAFLLSIYTSIYWLQTNSRIFESSGIFFAIIISVGKQIIFLLLVLLIILISFTHALYILLLPESDFSFKDPTNNNDTNNPWNLATAYHRVFENGTIDPNAYLIQQPDGNTNMFINFKTALLAMYLFLTGDSSSLSNWQYTDNQSLAIMIVFFSLLMGVYIMNLFIGLFSNAIEKVNSRVEYCVYKAEVLAEIELFYLLPQQRRWCAWFPEVIYYYADVSKVRQKIKEMIDEGEWNTNEFSELKQNLLKKLNIQHNPADKVTLQKVLDEIHNLYSNQPNKKLN